MTSILVLLWRQLVLCEVLGPKTLAKSAYGLPRTIEGAA